MTQAAKTVRFREGEQILTLWVEKAYPDGWLLGWCPELEKTLSVHPGNLIGEAE